MGFTPAFQLSFFIFSTPRVASWTNVPRCRGGIRFFDEHEVDFSRVGGTMKKNYLFETYGT